MTTDYDFWLFDLDGTLVDVEPACARKGWVPSATASASSSRTGSGMHSGTASAGHGHGRLRSVLDPDDFWPAFHAVEDPQARAEATYLHDDAMTSSQTLDTPVGWSRTASSPRCTDVSYTS